MLLFPVLYNEQQTRKEHVGTHTVFRHRAVVLKGGSTRSIGCGVAAAGLAIAQATPRLNLT